MATRATVANNPGSLVQMIPNISGEERKIKKQKRIRSGQVEKKKCGIRTPLNAYSTCQVGVEENQQYCQYDINTSRCSRKDKSISLKDIHDEIRASAASAASSSDPDLEQVAGGLGSQLLSSSSSSSSIQQRRGTGSSKTKPVSSFYSLFNRPKLKKSSPMKSPMKSPIESSVVVDDSQDSSFTNLVSDAFPVSSSSDFDDDLSSDYQHVPHEVDFSSASSSSTPGPETTSPRPSIFQRLGNLIPSMSIWKSKPSTSSSSSPHDVSSEPSSTLSSPQQQVHVSSEPSSTSSTLSSPSPHDVSSEPLSTSSTLSSPQQQVQVSSEPSTSSTLSSPHEQVLSEPSTSSTRLSPLEQVEDIIRVTEEILRSSSPSPRTPLYSRKSSPVSVSIPRTEEHAPLVLTNRIPKIAPKQRENISFRRPHRTVPGPDRVRFRTTSRIPIPSNIASGITPNTLYPSQPYRVSRASRSSTESDSSDTSFYSALGEPEGDGDDEPEGTSSTCYPKKPSIFWKILAAILCGLFALMIALLVNKGIFKEEVNKEGKKIKRIDNYKLGWAIGAFVIGAVVGFAGSIAYETITQKK